VTDAQVTDAGRILGLAESERQREPRRRISVLCIDAAPNAFLAHQLAERGGGIARFLTSSPDEEDITTALEDVLADWAEPVQVGLELHVGRVGAEAAGRSTHDTDHHTAIDLGDLPCGRAVWVGGRVPAHADGVSFALQERGTPVDLQPHLTPLQGQMGEGIKALFGARRILGLEYAIEAGLSGASLVDHLRRMGIDPPAAIARGGEAVYIENARQEARTALQEMLVRASLDYGLICSETAFVAVREEAGERVEARVIVPNALPAGWSDAFLSPQMKSGAAAPGMVARSMPMSLASAVAPAAAPPPSSRARRSEIREQQRPHKIEIWKGTPRFERGQAVLLDPSQVALPEQTRITRVEVRLDPACPADDLDRDLAIEIFVGDLAQPRARFRLADVIRLGGSRPLNIRRERGEPVRMVLSDPGGAWRDSAPRLFVSLALA
jgi:Ca-activated chloride channel family protein